MADYLASVERFAVFPSVEPGSIAPSFPTVAPEAPEPIGAILDDYRRLVEPNATHWQHPGFLAYFGTTASGPGILGEMLTTFRLAVGNLRTEARHVERAWELLRTAAQEETAA